jgi:F-type H+-transporting ATPase subunit epsilon
MLTVQIITPERMLPSMSADHVTIPAQAGEAGIRTGHAPYVCLLAVGRVEVKSQHAPNTAYAVRGGVAQVLRDQVTILTEAVSKPEEISEADLGARLAALLAAPPSEPLAFTAARAEALWLATQLRVAGKTVGDLSPLQLA